MEQPRWQSRTWVSKLLLREILLSRVMQELIPQEIRPGSLLSGSYLASHTSLSCGLAFVPNYSLVFNGAMAWKWGKARAGTRYVCHFIYSGAFQGRASKVACFDLGRLWVAVWLGGNQMIPAKNHFQDLTKYTTAQVVFCFFLSLGRDFRQFPLSICLDL